MGNVNMEASQINYRGGEKKMSVEEALKNTSEELDTLKSGLINVVKTVTETIATNDYRWLIFPSGRNILGAYMTVNNAYLSFIVCYDDQLGYLTNRYIDTTQTDVVYTRLEANTGYTITYMYI